MRRSECNGWVGNVLVLWGIVSAMSISVGLKIGVGKALARRLTFFFPLPLFLSFRSPFSPSHVFNFGSIRFHI